LVYIPRGQFIMGGDGEDNPEHTVALDAFWIYRNEVTNDMYRLCVATGACTPPAELEDIPDYTEPTLKDRPVVGVNWGQAQDYCTWMNNRLPTEAEWEKAARGTDGKTYPWGETQPTCQLANLQNCFGRTADILLYPEGKSFYEAFDMAGNVQEWTADWYLSNYYAQSPTENPLGPESGEVRSLRGSSFLSNAEVLPAAHRSFLEPQMVEPDLGFRCVVSGDAFAPFCQMTAYIPGEPPGGGEPANCTAPPVSIVPNTHCSDPSSDTAVADVDFSPSGDSEYLWAIFPTEGECSGPIDSDPPYTCEGPAGTTWSLKVCSACWLGGSRPEYDPVSATCDPGYELDPADGSCNYVGGPLDGAGACPIGTYDDAALGCVPFTHASDQCPSGYKYDTLSQCCQAEVLQPDGGSGAPGDPYSGCSPGYRYDTFDDLCFPAPLDIACETFELQLASCTSGCTDPDAYHNQAACQAGGCNWRCNEDCTSCPNCPGGQSCTETCRCGF